MSNATRIVTRNIARAEAPARRPRRGVTLYAGVREDGTRYLHNGDKVPVPLPFFQPMLGKADRPHGTKTRPTSRAAGQSWRRARHGGRR